MLPVHLLDLDLARNRHFGSAQCLAKSMASFAVHCPLSFCFMSSHHSMLPTSGEQAMSVAAVKAAQTTAMHELKRDNIKGAPLECRCHWVS